MVLLLTLYLDGLEQFWTKPELCRCARLYSLPSARVGDSACHHPGTR